MAQTHTPDTPTHPPHPTHPPLSTPSPATLATGPETLRDRVSKVINLIRPAVQADGGDLELVEITSDGLVRIRLHGACVGCPSSAITLQHGIENNLRVYVPEVRGVEAVD